MTRLALVVAVAENGVIGNANKLPWHLPADLKHFKAITWGKPVIMGRKTFQSIGRPLPGRDNIVISRSRRWDAGGVTVVPDLDTALAVAERAAAARQADEIMVIGGAQIYALTLPRADRIYYTKVHLSPAGDTLFPELDPVIWRETSREHHTALGEFPAHTFLVYDRAQIISNL
jgi:dihydrofolate reductase